MPLLDLDALLRPIPGADPVGPSLRYEPLYDELRELRREDDAQAPRGVWKSKLKLADWGAVVARTQEALASRSKDLQLAAWLTEALAVRHGMAGAAAGLALLAGLVDRFWPCIWPGAGDDGDEDGRQTVLEWLDTRLADRLMLQPAASFGEPPPSWFDQVSLQRRRAGSQGRAVAEDEERGAALAKAVARTSAEDYLRMLADVHQAEAALAALLAALRQAGVDSPPAFSQLRTTWGTIQSFLRSELSSRGVRLDQIAAASPPPDPEPDAVDTATPPAAPAGPISSREAAYRQLAEVAQFLEALEPHSPVPALLRRAIGWGQMRLPELLAELMKEEGGPVRLLRIAPGHAAE